MKGGNEPFRDYDKTRDLDSVKRIWREVGWATEAHEIAQIEGFFDCGRARVATINGEAECSVHTAPGTYNLGGTELSLCAVTAVTTSRIARGQSFARRLTADQLLFARVEGAQMAVLGMFDQGFYDQLGFGTGAYDLKFSIDPSLLQVDHRLPSPLRFGIDDAPALHKAMLNRMKVHGAVNLLPEIMFKAELGFLEHGFGLGYKASNGDVSHFVWLDGEEGEHGPYTVVFLAYQSTDQLLELLGLLKSLSDQVYSVSLFEPAQIQLQSLLAKPLRNQSITKNSKHKNEIRAFAWWQARVLDVSGCVSALSSLSGKVAFNLNVVDPLDEYATEDVSGIGGEYVVTLGEGGGAELGKDANLPQLNCDVNALTRLLMAVAPATSLAVTDGLAAPEELLRQLDEVLRLPKPITGWEF